MRRKSVFCYTLLTFYLITSAAGYYYKKRKTNSDYYSGQVIDHLNGVSVYYNGTVSHISGRNRTSDGYNLGLKYQCVEFVKRYYYQYLHHKMPNSYGHAKDFFDNQLNDGEYNVQRDLIQYQNPSNHAPKVDDLLVFDGYLLNRYGHVAIISQVTPTNIEIIQQNAGAFANTRTIYSLNHTETKWTIENKRVLGWLRKE